MLASGIPVTLTLIPVAAVNGARFWAWYCQKLSGGDQMVISLATGDALPEAAALDPADAEAGAEAELGADDAEGAEAGALEALLAAAGALEATAAEGDDAAELLAAGLLVLEHAPASRMTAPATATILRFETCVRNAPPSGNASSAGWSL